MLELTVWALITLSLIVSVVMMEQAIGKTTVGVANKRFVYYHIFGFALWLLCYTVQQGLFFGRMIMYGQYL